MEKQLEDRRFIRIHKSYLVNFRYIYRVNAKTVVPDNGFELPVSRTYQNEAQKKFKEYMQCC